MSVNANSKPAHCVNDFKFTVLFHRWKSRIDHREIHRHASSVCRSGDKWIFGQNFVVPARLNNRPRITGSFGSFKDDRGGIGLFSSSAAGLNPFTMQSQSDVSPVFFHSKYVSWAIWEALGLTAVSPRLPDKHLR